MLDRRKRGLLLDVPGAPAEPAVAVVEVVQRQADDLGPARRMREGADVRHDVEELAGRRHLVEVEERVLDAEHAGAEREVARLAGPEELGPVGEHPQRERVLLGGVRVALTTAHATAVVLQQPERERVVATVDRVRDLIAADLVPRRRVGGRVEHERARPREAVIGRQPGPRVPGGQDDVPVVDRGRFLDHASAKRIGRRAAQEREVIRGGALLGRRDARGRLRLGRLVGRVLRWPRLAHQPLLEPLVGLHVVDLAGRRVHAERQRDAASGCAACPRGHGSRHRRRAAAHTADRNGNRHGVARPRHATRLTLSRRVRARSGHRRRNVPRRGF